MKPGKKTRLGLISTPELILLYILHVFIHHYKVSMNHEKKRGIIKEKLR